MDDSTVYTSDFVDITPKEEPKNEQNNEPKKELYKPFGIASMIFGILSLASYVASFSMPLAFLYPFVGLVFASFDLKRNKERTSFGRVGYYTSLIALIIEIVILIIFVLLIALMAFLFILTFEEFGLL